MLSRSARLADDWINRELIQRFSRHPPLGRPRPRSWSRRSAQHFCWQARWPPFVHQSGLRGCRCRRNQPRPWSQRPKPPFAFVVRDLCDVQPGHVENHRFSDCSRFRLRRSRAAILCETLRKWQGRRDSNPRPSVLETDALPTELHPYPGSPVKAGSQQNQEEDAIRFENASRQESPGNSNEKGRSSRTALPCSRNFLNVAPCRQHAGNFAVASSAALVSRGCSRRPRSRRSGRPPGSRSAGPSPSRSARSAPP